MKKKTNLQAKNKEFNKICENISNLSIEGIHVNYECSKVAFEAAKEHFKYDITDFTSKEEMKTKILKELSKKKEFKKVLEAFAQS